MVNARTLAVGTKVLLANEATAEVVDNPQDGMWVMVRYLASPESPAQVGTEELVFVTDLVEVVETP